MSPHKSEPWTQPHPATTPSSPRPLSKPQAVGPEQLRPEIYLLGSVHAGGVCHHLQGFCTGPTPAQGKPISRAHRGPSEAGAGSGPLPSLCLSAHLGLLLYRKTKIDTHHSRSMQQGPPSPSDTPTSTQQCSPRHCSSLNLSPTRRVPQPVPPGPTSRGCCGVLSCRQEAPKGLREIPAAHIC